MVDGHYEIFDAIEPAQREMFSKSQACDLKWKRLNMRAAVVLVQEVIDLNISGKCLYKLASSSIFDKHQIQLWFGFYEVTVKHHRSISSEREGGLCGRIVELRASLFPASEPVKISAHG